MNLRDMDKTMKPDVEIKIRAIMEKFNTEKIDKSAAIKELRSAMGLGQSGSTLHSDEEIWILTEKLIKGWDHEKISRADE